MSDKLKPIPALVAEKVILQNRINAIGYTNVYGASAATLVALEMDKIEAYRRLDEIQKEIDLYIKGERQ